MQPGEDCSTQRRTITTILKGTSVREEKVRRLSQVRLLTSKKDEIPSSAIYGFRRSLHASGRVIPLFLPSFGESTFAFVTFASSPGFLAASASCWWWRRRRCWRWRQPPRPKKRTDGFFLNVYIWEIVSCVSHQDDDVVQQGLDGLHHVPFLLGWGRHRSRRLRRRSWDRCRGHDAACGKK